MPRLPDGRPRMDCAAATLPALRRHPAVDRVGVGRVPGVRRRVLTPASGRAVSCSPGRSLDVWTSHALAAWPSGLGKGLQSPAQRFDSARRLQVPAGLG